MGIELKKAAIDLGLVTTNGESMLAFYRDLLGLELVREMPMPGGQGRMFQLACGDSLVKVVVLPAVPAQAAPGGIRGAAGFRYFTITVGNLTHTMKACADAGRKVVVPEREIRPGVRIGMVEDPDGNWVKFLAVD
jgi:catechol 2,3-dioxygenase-like lactoylglutathione lyase family enzyme